MLEFVNSVHCDSLYFKVDEQGEGQNFAYLTLKMYFFHFLQGESCVLFVFDKVQADLEICLDDMKKEGVIEKQHSATDWVSSLLSTTISNGKLQ